MHSVDPKQLTTELEAGFSTVTALLALSSAAIYQHVAHAAGHDNAWIGAALRSQAEMIEREGHTCRKPQFAAAYAQLLERFARQFQEPEPVTLTLIEGGAADAAEDG